MKTNLFFIFFSGLVLNNIILMQGLLPTSFLGMSAKTKRAVNLGIVAIVLMLLVTILTWLLYHFVLVSLHLEFLVLISSVIIIILLTQFLGGEIIKQFLGKWRSELPLFTLNCALLAVPLLNLQHQYNLGESIVHTLGISFGYWGALVLTATLRQRLNLSPVAKMLQGYPIVLITLGILSLVFSSIAQMLKMVW
ncbi:MAG: Rnf-Nqr domain containing protein [Candidatus Edwardsbacteria bacterium]